MLNNSNYNKLINLIGEQNKEIKKLQDDFKNYKKYINYQLHKYLPKEKRLEALKDWFFEETGEFLDYNNPLTFNQKIQWLKMFDSTDIKTQLTDKILAKDFVKEKIGEEYIIPLLGVYNKFEDIDFDKLPNKFVIKANHGSAYNIIVKDKKKIDKDEIKNKINKWLNTNYAFVDGIEIHYENIKPQILIEEYQDNNGNCLQDYKVWCFNGEPKFIQILYNKHDTGLTTAFYDLNWKKQEFICTFFDGKGYSYNKESDDVIFKKPNNLELLIKLAKILSKGFIFVRVDLFILDDNSIKFGEMTFTNMTGICKWVPEKYNRIIGDMIKLPQ